LIIAAAGILAHGIHELQEAAVLPGPYSGAPITPTDLMTGAVAVGLTGGPFWLASFPFGWAFDLTANIDPSTWGAALVKALFGLTPRMSWLEVIAWLGYLGAVLPRFLAWMPRRRPTETALDRPTPSEKPDLESAVRE
jgi:high-affinity iron transporter